MIDQDNRYAPTNQLGSASCATGAIGLMIALATLGFAYALQEKFLYCDSSGLPIGPIMFLIFCGPPLLVASIFCIIALVLGIMSGASSREDGLVPLRSEPLPDQNEQGKQTCTTSISEQKAVPPAGNDGEENGKQGCKINNPNCKGQWARKWLAILENKKDAR